MSPLSIEPTTIPDDIITLMANDEKLCRYLHIPLQSGHDYVLKKMNRRYDMAEFTEFLQACYQGIPDICLGTDLIVGYPGETDAYFDETMDHLREQPYAYMHVFSYSERTMANCRSSAIASAGFLWSNLSVVRCRYFLSSRKKVSGPV